MPIKSMTGTEVKDSKSKPLFGMFNAIPKRYDQINKIITLGLDKKWRNIAAHECLGSGPRRILDLGCGTGDMAINLVQLAKTYVTVYGLDFSPGMLEAARTKADALVGKDRIAFTQSEAASLPFANDYFDTISISFAFRNLIYKNPIANFHLAEVFRVLAPGGRLVIVESSQPKSKFIRWWFHLYLRTYVFWIGWWLSGNKSAYKYLTESARRFFGPDEIIDLLKASGFREVTYRPLLWGAAGVHIAVK
jgi:demethylmenaquinone methyltransferase / 2-methoxy-6-polyprenyl-1,4-benzoquinol methylase